MKFLIWFLCLLVFTALNELLGMAIGFKLGYLILYLLCSVTAKSLCKKWEERQSGEKEEPKELKNATPVLPDVPAAPVLIPDPVPNPRNQEEQRLIVVTDADKKELKNRALMYFPRNLEQIAGQRQVLQMLTVCVPSVRSCVEAAERELWPQVERNMLKLSEAVARCAYNADQMIGITLIDPLKLEGQSEEVLLKAWIALDYYAYVLKPEYSVNIRKLQEEIAVVLKQKEQLP